MKLINGLYSLVEFGVTRVVQLAQIRIEKTLYKYKYFRTRAGYDSDITP